MAGSQVVMEPFPHMVVEGALSSTDYRDLHLGWDTASLLPGLAARTAKENRAPVADFTWKPSLAARLSAAFGVEGTPTIGRYMLRRKGYVLKPHIDPPNFLLTVLHYLPKDGQREDIGTIIYRTSEAAYHHDTGAEYFTCACEPVIVVPFKPNTLLAFLNTPYSAHGTFVFPEDRLAYQWHIEA